MSRVADQGSQTSCAGAVPSSGAPAPVSPSESKPRPTALFEAMNSNPCNRLDDAAQTETCEKTALGLPKKIFNLFLLRAMNEGFADFWGWLYSKDDFFISKSLPSETTARRLDIGGGRLMNEKLMREISLTSITLIKFSMMMDERTMLTFWVRSTRAFFVRAFMIW